jgi:hypothetical protein
MMMRQAEWDISDLITKFLQSSDENQSYALPGNYWNIPLSIFKNKSF